MTRDADLLVEVATRFYVRGDTPEKIAADLGVHGSTVSRALKKARMEGIVRIEIVPPIPESKELASRLCEMFPISRAIVVDQEREDIPSLGRAAAVHIQSLISNGMRIGIGWGSTLYETVRALKPSSVHDVRVTQLIGGFGLTTPGIQAHELIRIVIATYPHAAAQYLMAPAIVETPQIRDSMLKDASIRGSLDEARLCGLAIVGIGSLDDRGSMFAHGHITTEERHRLVENGAVGEVLSQFFDSQGRRVPDELEARTIALSLDDLAAVPIVVAVACGVKKVAAIEGACRTGVVRILVTDRVTAREVLRFGGTVFEGPGGRAVAGAGTRPGGDTV